ncbi:MAG: S9 family peptidase [Prevotellaceae bacterium]|nr:S9 family peptidase [Prevotellaceae bacterium]
MNHSGSMISFVSRDKTKQDIVSLCVADINGKTITKFPVKFVRDLSVYKWAYTDKHLLVPQDTDGDENNHLICINLDTARSTDLTPFKNCRAYIVKMSRKHPDEILIGLNKDNPVWYDLYRLNIKTGDMTLVFKNREFATFCCSTAPSIICNDDFDVVMVRKPLLNGDVEYSRVKNGKLELFEKVGFEDSKTTEFLAVSGDGEIIYKRDSVNRDKVALVAQNLKTKEKKILFEHSQADTGELESIIFDEHDNPLLIHFEYLQAEPIALQDHVKHIVSSLKKNLKDEILHVLAVSKNTWLAALQSDVKSTKYCMYDVKTGQLRFLFSACPALDKYTFSKMKPAVIKSRDGLDLVCYLTKSADGKDKASAPLVVMPHGGPWYRDSRGFDPEVQLLADRGYSVLQVNYRGSTGFGKHFLNAANGHLDRMHNDLLDAVDWAIKNGVADKNKIAICGWSYGGYAALRGLTHSSDTFCCAVDFIGPSSWLTVLKTIPDYWLPDLSAWYNWAGNPNTDEGIAQLSENSPITKIDRIKKPLLIMQGANDPRVNRAESDQMVSALKKANVPVTYVVYPNEGHGFLKEANGFSSWAFTEKFLARHLGGRYEPVSDEELRESSCQIVEDDAELSVK